MNKQILTFTLGILLVAVNVFAQDVTISADGNVATGTSNTNANLEVLGASGEDGIVGSTASTGRSGVYGINTSNNNYGTLGHSDYGVYGESGSGFAGFFQGNAKVTGNLNVGSLTAPGIGDITKVSTGAGLSGGGVSGDVMLNVDFGGSGAAGTAARSDHNHNAAYAPVSHSHSGSDISGTIDSTKLNVGTTAGTVAAGDHTHPASGSYGGVAVVAVSGGDYADPVTAMDSVGVWCGASSAVNPCLLKIMPGVYDIGGNSIQMISYVDIEGSGENVTKITGSVDNADWVYITSGLIYGADHAELRFLTMENTSAGNQTVTMINDNSSPKISDVTIIASGGTVNYGVYNNSSGATINMVTVAPVGADTYGLFNEGTCNVEITNSRIQGSTYSISASPGAVTKVAGTKLDGTLYALPSTIKCFGVYDAGYASVTCP